MFTSKSVVSSSLVTALVSSVVLAGCAVATEAPTGSAEALGTTSEAQTFGKTMTYQSSVIEFAAALDDFGDARVSVTNGNGLFVPPPAMQKLLYPSGIPANPDVAFTVPTFTVSGSFPYGDGVVTTQSLTQVGAPRVEINDTHLDLFVSGEGTFAIKTTGLISVTPSYTMNSVNVQARFVVGANGALAIDTVLVTGLQGSISGCGIAGWCDSFASGLLGGAPGAMQTQMKNALAAELAQPIAQTAWLGFLNAFANVTPDGGPPWSTIASSIVISGGEMTMNETRNAPPTPVCTYTVACGDQVTLDCTGQFLYTSLANPNGTPVTATLSNSSLSSETLTWTGSPTVAYQTAHACSAEFGDSYTTCADFQINLPHQTCIIRRLPPVGTSPLL